MVSFSGFTRLDGNFLYCPNQFLDLCLPHCSRGAVRLVAYLLDQTLGWLDRQGNPISQTISVSYQQLIHQAGISRGAIRKALDEAVHAGFIRPIQEGRAAASGESPQKGTYALRWDERDEYQREMDLFQGFFMGDGHRTPIPNDFFRQVIPNEPLVVTKVVGTVLRHTVGYQNQFGGRRSQTPLAYRFIQEFAHIPDPKSLSQAISSAIASKYIICVKEGRFHSNPAQRKPASYAVCWEGGVTSQEQDSGRPMEERFRKPSRDAVQNSQQERFRKPGNSGSGNPAEEQFNNPSKDKTTLKNTLKQQHETTAVAATSTGIQLLTAVGFDAGSAMRLSGLATDEQIARQISWLPLRNASHNRLGMLRRALEENWSEPEQSPDVKTLLGKRRERDREFNSQEQQAHQKTLAVKELRHRRREELKSLWENLSQDERQQIELAAFQRLPGEVLKNLFRTRESHRLRACLHELERQLNSGVSPKTSDS